MARSAPASCTLGLVALAFGSTTPAVTAERGPTARVAVEACETWSGIFGGSEVSFTYRVASDAPIAGAFAWVLTVNRRTIARGESPLAVARDRPARATVRLAIPPVKEGVVLAGELTVSVYAERKAARAPVAVDRRTVSIWSRDPWAHRSAWLRERHIRLFDPRGDTARVFDEANIPHHRLSRWEGLGSIQQGLVVVGSGVSLDEHRDLADELFALGARGIPVVWLAPSAGRFDLPGTAGSRHPMPDALALKGPGVIRALDKRLDADGWPPDGTMNATGLALRTVGDRVVAEVVEPGHAWPWLELRWPKAGAAVVICGFAIVEQWHAGPVPRHLLARILEHVTEEKELEP